MPSSRRTGAARGKGRVAQRGGVGAAAQPPGLGADDVEGGTALRVEVVRRMTPDAPTVLGAIVR